MTLRNEVTGSALQTWFGGPNYMLATWKMLQEANAHPELTGLVPAKGGG